MRYWILSLLMTMFATTALAKSSNSGFAVTGSCELETTREKIEIETWNPHERYGSLGAGRSSLGDLVRIWTNYESVYVEISSDSGASFSRQPLAIPGKARIVTGLFLKRAVESSNTWLSCDLTVERTNEEAL